MIVTLLDDHATHELVLANLLGLPLATDWQNAAKINLANCPAVSHSLMVRSTPAGVHKTLVQPWLEPAEPPKTRGR